MALLPQHAEKDSDNPGESTLKVKMTKVQAKASAPSGDQTR